VSTDLFHQATSSAVISPDGVYRYQLRRQWGDDLTCGFVMLNPSTADADVDDPTIRRCLGFARGWGYDALIVVNLFALRATDPKRLKTHPDPIGDNDRHIAAAVREMDMVICAWGAHPLAAKRATKVETILRRYRACPEICCLGKTRDGAPRHPLYVKGDVHPVPFDGGVAA
jgi:hypothetical protein